MRGSIVILAESTNSNGRIIQLVVTEYYGEQLVTIRHNPDTTALVMDQHVGMLSHPSALIDDACRLFGMSRAVVQRMVAGKV